ncbi:hypothetical protein TNCV_4511881 [Trichonephila clavipes]|nr:hypothetical protein TNCV_4511881 [Trichonephila clavipes]
MIHPSSQSETESHCHHHGNARVLSGGPPCVAPCLLGSLVRIPIVLKLSSISKNVVDDFFRKVDGMNKAKWRITIDGVSEELRIGH